jgi:two-component system, NarL family, nitrate/nitrite response regulator NarL
MRQILRHRHTLLIEYWPVICFTLNVETNAQQIRLLQLDCYAIMHDVVRALLSNRDKDVLITQSQDFKQGLSLLKKKNFDILMIGINNAGAFRHEFPKHLKLLGHIRSVLPDLKIIVYSMGRFGKDIADIMNSGADWFISNSMGYEALLEAIRSVKRGQRHLGHQLWDLFKNSLEYLAGLADTLIPKNTIFSQRELEVLDLIASGYSSKEISNTLYITSKTVETHRKNLMKKSKTKNTAELISFSYQNGLL